MDSLYNENQKLNYKEVWKETHKKFSTGLRETALLPPSFPTVFPAGSLESEVTAPLHCHRLSPQW